MFVGSIPSCLPELSHTLAQQKWQLPGLGLETNSSGKKHMKSLCLMRNTQGYPQIILFLMGFSLINYPLGSAPIPGNSHIYPFSWFCSWHVPEVILAPGRCLSRTSVPTIGKPAGTSAVGELTAVLVTTERHGGNGSRICSAAQAWLNICIYRVFFWLSKGSLEVKLPTIWTDGKAEVWKSPGGEEKKWEDQERERERRKKMQVHEKVGMSRFTVFILWFVALEGRKVGSLKRRVRSQLARWEMNNCTLLWREAHFQVKMHKAHHSWTTFGSWDVAKVHAVVARSTFPSQNVQSTPFLDHFGSWDVEKVHAVLARSTFGSQKYQNMAVFTNLTNIT